MAILISGTTNDITINGVSVATDAEVTSAVAPLATTEYVDGNIGVNTASLLNGDIGSYAFLIGTSLNGTFTAGTTYSGSGLKYTGINGEAAASGFPYSGGASGSVTGTWRAMGTCLPRVDRYPSTIFLRIA